MQPLPSETGTKGRNLLQDIVKFANLYVIFYQRINGQTVLLSVMWRQVVRVKRVVAHRRTLRSVSHCLQSSMALKTQGNQVRKNKFDVVECQPGK